MNIPTVEEAEKLQAAGAASPAYVNAIKGYWAQQPPQEAAPDMRLASNDALSQVQDYAKGAGPLPWSAVPPEALHQQSPVMQAAPTGGVQLPSDMQTYLQQPNSPLPASALQASPKVAPIDVTGSPNAVSPAAGAAPSTPPAPGAPAEQSTLSGKVGEIEKDAQKRGDKVIDNQALVEKEKAEKLADAKQGTADLYRKQAADFSALWRIHPDLEQAALDRKRKADEDFANARVDPERYWANKSTGSKIMAGISMVLGAFGGKQNAGLAAIESQINKDIEAQKGNQQHLKDVAAAAGQNVAMTLETFKTREARMLAQQAIGLKAAESMVDAVSAQFGGKEALSKAEQLKEQMRQASDARMQQAIMTEAKFQNDLQGHRISAGATLGAAQIHANSAEKIARINQETELGKQALVNKAAGDSLEVPGYGYSQSKEQAKEARDAVGAYGNFKEKLDAVKRYVGKNGWIKLKSGDTDAAAALTALTDLRLSLSGLYHAGALDKGVQEEYAKLLPEHPNDIGAFTGTNMAQLNALGSIAKRGFEARIKPMIQGGGRPTSPAGWVPNGQ